MNSPVDVAQTDCAGQTLPRSERPGPDLLRHYGDALFLAFRSPRHQEASVATLRRHLEPPLQLGQYRIFYFDGVPRGLYTWAWFDTEAEKRLVRGDPLGADDWISGDRLWIVDMIAPYRGMSSSMARFIMTRGNFTDREFTFRRVTNKNTTVRIVNIDFRREKLSRVLHDTDFLD
jgi:cytolysin-activating lysine-acyltransferase